MVSNRNLLFQGSIFRGKLAVSFREDFLFSRSPGIKAHLLSPQLEVLNFYRGTSLNKEELLCERPTALRFFSGVEKIHESLGDKCVYNLPIFFPYCFQKMYL